MIFVLIPVYILVSTLGLAGMKASTEIVSLAFFASAICYASGAGIWVLILRAFPLSVAFPIASSGLIMSTALVGWVIFKERFGFLHIFGVSLILLGIICVSKSR
jgi:multidrug transporter EmrE-like cation transporter